MVRTMVPPVGAARGCGASSNCQPVLASVPEDHADGSGKTEFLQRDIRFGEHHQSSWEAALVPDVLLRKRPPSVALPIAGPIAKQIGLAKWEKYTPRYISGMFSATSG